MYIILVTDNHELIATNRERIMQRSNLVNNMCFLVPQTYDNLDMSKATICLEYLTPVGHEYKSEILTVSDELYQNHLQYTLPFNTALTKEPGDVELQLTFTFVEMDEDGVVSQYVRKTSTTKVTIVPIAAWSDVIPDSALTALDQRLIKTDLMIQQLADINEAIAEDIPEDLVVDNGKLYLADSEGNKKGNGADIVLPRIPDNSDGANDGLIEIEDDELKDDSTSDENGNFSEL